MSTIGWHGKGQHWFTSGFPEDMITNLQEAGREGGIGVLREEEDYEEGREI